MIVGHFLGKQALAAVGGTTGTLINLLVGFFVGLSSGATVVISQHYGANKEDKVQWACLLYTSGRRRDFLEYLPDVPFHR